MQLRRLRYSTFKGGEIEISTGWDGMGWDGDLSRMVKVYRQGGELL